MEVKNGIIIDGVLHELKETKRNDCLKCSLRDLCQNEFGNGCLCWINLASESEMTNNEFKCRGKVTEIKTRKKEMNDGVYFDQNGSEVIVINGFEYSREEFDSLVDMCGDCNM